MLVDIAITRKILCQYFIFIDNKDFIYIFLKQIYSLPKLIGQPLPLKNKFPVLLTKVWLLGLTWLFENKNESKTFDSMNKVIQNLKITVTVQTT